MRRPRLRLSRPLPALRPVLLLLPALVLGLPGCLTVNFPGFGQGPLQETVVFGEGDPKIVLIDVAGSLSERPDEPGPLGLGGRESIVARVREQLERAADDDAVRALLLRVHTPGGTASASEVLYREIERLKAEREIPVVAQLMGLATSGGYYVAMSADHVRAYPTTVTGSIGVIFAGINVSGTLDKIGARDQTLVTGPFKDAGSPLRPMRPEERAQLGGVLDDLFVRFLDVVEAGRPELERARIEELADGRIYSARQALEAGLVDAIGDLEGAVEEARRLADVEEASVVIYHRPGQLPENLFSAAAPASAPARSALESLLGPGPAFLYLWTPGAR